MQHKPYGTVRPEEFYPLIGQITIMHAGIEQDIKSVLNEDWDICAETTERKCGLVLRKFFLEKINAFKIPQKDYQEYEKIIDRFRKASDKRNDIVKATYGLTKDTREVFKYDLKARGQYDHKMALENWLRKGSRVITSEELKSLIQDLSKIREDYFQLSRKVFLEKTAALM